MQRRRKCDKIDFYKAALRISLDTEIPTNHCTSLSLCQSLSPLSLFLLIFWTLSLPRPSEHYMLDDRHYIIFLDEACRIEVGCCRMRTEDTKRS